MEERLERVLDLYRGREAALRYEGVHRGHRREQREARCLRRALSGLGAGSVVLDLPCGAGRMFEALASTGARVVGADASESMVERARGAADREPRVREVRVENVFATSFADRAFDAVVCNRLLHHFSQREDRRAALAELARISRGPVVFSFFCTHSFDAIKTRVRRALGKPRSDRNAVSYLQIHCDAAAAGLDIEAVVPTLPGISQQWYVIASRSAPSA
jgi:2-polyprenyl-3-methyl-5-hydroxy-6-metoxy-1,4-benzoquinol methylase